MHIEERQPGDREELARRIARETDAKQRDRYRTAWLAIEGEATRTIMGTLARSRGFVQRWAYTYRDHGLEAIVEKPRGGSAPKRDAETQTRFIERFKAGPTEADGGRCRLRGKDAVRILADEFGVGYSLNGAYKLLHRHGLVCLKPRPQRRHHDPQAMAAWLDRAPFCPAPPRAACDKIIEIGLQDEARFGQQGTLTSVWADKGSRPRARRPTEYDWCYLYAAVNPLSGESSAMLAPTVNADFMNIHLKWISHRAGPDQHVVLVLDGAGGHVARALKVPDNLTLLLPPPYSPELNCIERVWAYRRSHYLSNRIYENYDHLLQAGHQAWNRLTEADLRSICRTEWITHEIER